MQTDALEPDDWWQSTLFNIYLKGDTSLNMQAEEKEEESKAEKEEESKPASDIGKNPASSVEGSSDSGLAKLDADQEEDNTPVEDKIEAVAGAIGSQDDSPDKLKVREDHCILHDLIILRFYTRPHVSAGEAGAVNAIGCFLEFGRSSSIHTLRSI